MKSKFITLQAYRDTLGPIPACTDVYEKQTDGTFLHLGWVSYLQAPEEGFITIENGVSRQEVSLSNYVEMPPLTTFVTVEDFLSNGGELSYGRSIYREDSDEPSGMLLIGTYAHTDPYYHPPIDNIPVTFIGDLCCTGCTAYCIFVQVKTQPIYE